MCTDSEKPVSFYLVRLTHKPPCVLIRIAFLGGTAGSIRQKVCVRHNALLSLFNLYLWLSISAIRLLLIWKKSYRAWISLSVPYLKTLPKLLPPFPVAKFCKNQPRKSFCGTIPFFGHSERDITIYLHYLDTRKCQWISCKLFRTIHLLVRITISKQSVLCLVLVSWKQIPFNHLNSAVISLQVHSGRLLVIICTTEDGSGLSKALRAWRSV